MSLMCLFCVCCGYRKPSTAAKEAPPPAQKASRRNSFFIGGVAKCKTITLCIRGMDHKVGPLHTRTQPHAHTHPHLCVQLRTKSMGPFVKTTYIKEFGCFLAIIHLWMQAFHKSGEGTSSYNGSDSWVNLGINDHNYTLSYCGLNVPSISYLEFVFSHVITWGVSLYQYLSGNDSYYT